MPSSPPSDPALDARLRLIVESHRRLTGRDLIHSPLTLAGQAATRQLAGIVDCLAFPSEGLGERADALRLALWEAPCAILAHGTEDDPVFFYGNRLALELFEMSFDEFARLPSRLSAEPLAQDSRAKVLQQVTRQGFVDGYSGVRIASSGRRFMISGTTVWNLVDEAGDYHGQAAAFSDWQPL